MLETVLLCCQLRSRNSGWLSKKKVNEKEIKKKQRLSFVFFKEREGQKEN